MPIFTNTLLIAPAKKTRSNEAPHTSLHRVLVATIFVIVIALALPFAFPGRLELEGFRRTVSWYLHWLHLGVFNSLGLRANTWLTHVGPFISRVTSSAYICKTMAFAKSDVTGMTCPKGNYLQGTVNIATILLKVFPDVLAWSIGGALADLVPFILAIAFTHALDLTKGDPRAAKAVAFLEKIRKSFGPTEALLFAAVPHPLVDSTGLLCGLLGLPLMTFLRTLVLGKILLRGTLQAAMVIAVFSKDLVEPLLAAVKTLSPHLASALYTEINAQRNLYQQAPAALASVTFSLRSAMKFAHLGLLVILAAYSVAVMTKLRRPLF